MEASTLFRLTVCLVCILLAGPVSLHSQQGAPASVKFMITCLDPIAGGVAEYEVGVPGDLTALKVPPNRFVGPFTVPLREDANLLDFYQTGNPKPAFSVTVTESERDNFFIFLIPSEGGYRAMKIHAPASRLKGGDRYLMNATGKPLAIKYGEKDRLLVRSGESEILKLTAANADGVVKVLMAQETDGKFELIRSLSWYCDPRFRRFVFIYDKNGGKIGFYTVSERIDP